MTTPSDNNSHPDLYQSFKFRLKWDGKYIAGVKQVSGIKENIEAIEYREPSNPWSKKIFSMKKSSAITLERGTSYDPEFIKWANLYIQSITDFGDTPSLLDMRKDITIELYNEAEELVVAYVIIRCWVSEFTALPKRHTNSRAISIQKIKLENEGWSTVSW
ncbi:MAG: phage tail protein [Cyclobacteriaceae bacterium]